MELSNDEILIISGLLIKLLKNDIEQKNINEQKQPEFIEFKDLIKEKRKGAVQLDHIKNVIYLVKDNFK